MCSNLYAGNKKPAIHVAYVIPQRKHVLFVPNLRLMGTAKILAKAKPQYTMLRLINPKLLKPRSDIIFDDKFSQAMKEAKRIKKPIEMMRTWSRLG